jgi:hypothetical protein
LYGITPEAAKKIVASVSIVHPHGTVGNHQRGGADFRRRNPPSGESTKETLKTIAQGMPGEPV